MNSNHQPNMSNKNIWICSAETSEDILTKIFPCRGFACEIIVIDANSGVKKAPLYTNHLAGHFLYSSVF